MPRQQPEKRPLLVQKITRFTNMAVLVVINNREVWIPKSQIHEFDELNLTEDPTEIYVAPWFIKKQGLGD